MHAKKEKNILLMFENITQILKNNLEIKELSAFFRGITFEYQGDFYCLNFLYSFAAERNLNGIKKHGEVYYKRFL